MSPSGVGICSLGAQHRMRLEEPFVTCKDMKILRNHDWFANVELRLSRTFKNQLFYCVTLTFAPCLWEQTVNGNVLTYTFLRRFPK